MKMNKPEIKYATIREDDYKDGKIITLGYSEIQFDDGTYGYKVETSNGDTAPVAQRQSEQACIEDINNMWGDWNTFRNL